MIETEWSHEINVACGNSDAPQTVEFVWTDFKASHSKSRQKIETSHPKIRHRFFYID